MIRNRKSDGNLNNHPCIQNTESQSGETERHQNEINIQIANDMADGCLQGNQAVSYVTGENNSASAGNLVQQELVRSQTETMSLATTLDSTIYNTPMTSCSGFDVYITAAEESSYSLGGHSVGFDNKIASDYQLSTESKDNTANERRAQMLRSEPDLHLSSRCGKGGERIGESRKYSPKKSTDSSASSKDEKPESTCDKSEIKQFKPNGSLKVQVPDDLHSLKKGIMGGTKAIFIQKAKDKFIMLKVLKELKGKKSFRPIAEETEKNADHETETKDRDKDTESEEFNILEQVPVSGIQRQQPAKFMILHYSPFKAVWDWVVLFLVLYTAVFTPYVVAFLLNEDETRMRLNRNSWTRSQSDENTKADPLVLIDLIVDLMFIADIVINFRTTYLHNGEVVIDPKKIAINYVKGWFVIDTIAAIPFDLLLFGSGNSETMTIAGFLKLARLLRLLRVLRRIEQFAEYGAAVLMLLMVSFTLIAHWLACIFYAIAYVERPYIIAKTSWLDKLAEQCNTPYMANDTTSGPTIRSKYITALYFTFTTLTSIGFGNIAPHTNAEKIFAIFAMLLGSLLSAAIFGNVSSIMLRVYQGSDEFHEKVQSIKEFINFHHLPKNLATRLQESFQHSWSYTNGIDMNNVLKSFPECLQSDICLHLNKNLLNNCPAFKGASPGCLRALSMKFKTTHAPPGDTLIHPGDILTAIYFIARGSIEIMKSDSVMAILGKDDIFGADMSAGTSGKSLYFVRALSYCDINKIEMEDLKEILQTYPEFAEEFITKFQVTFDLKRGTLLQRKYKSKMEDETLRFIRQKRPRLQCKRRNAEDAGRTNLRQRRSERLSRHKLSVGDHSGSDEEGPGILEFSTEAATECVDIEEDTAYTGNLDRKNSMQSIAGAMTNFFSVVTGKVMKEKRAKDFKPFLSRTQGLPRSNDVNSNGLAPQHGLSPIESSASYTPKSLSSSGQQWKFSNIDFEIQQHPEKGNLTSLNDIDHRLESLHDRMNNFENELFQTVDAILHLLGHQPKVTRESVAVKQEKTTKPKGARLIKNASELDRILQNMS